MDEVVVSFFKVDTDIYSIRAGARAFLYMRSYLRLLYVSLIKQHGPKITHYMLFFCQRPFQKMWKT